MSVSAGTPIWGTSRDASFVGLLREGEKILYLAKFYEIFERNVKKAL
jgi:hypothetical protein